MLLVCRPKRGTRISLGSGGGGSVGGSDSIDDLGMDPADFPGAAAQGASTAKRTAFLEGRPFKHSSQFPVVLLPKLFQILIEVNEGLGKERKGSAFSRQWLLMQSVCMWVGMCDV
jgi:hypothetical protein